MILSKSFFPDLETNRKMSPSESGLFSWKIKEIWVKNLLACIYLVLDIIEKFHDKIEIDIPQSFDIRIVQASRNEGRNTFQVSTERLNIPQRSS